MRYPLTFFTLVLIAQPALAQSLSPMQQYLQNEAGYAPAKVATPQPTPAYTTNPYDVAQTPTTVAVPNPEVSGGEESQVNSGVRGMNF